LNKAELRKYILSLRAGLREEERREKSAAIGERLFALEEFRAAATVLFFVGFGSEVQTLAMIGEALLQGKRIAVPKVGSDKKDLELRELKDPRAQLRPGTMGILEPDETCPLVPLEEIDLIIVPAVAWDEKDYRLGYGGGFYDRLLARAGSISRVGIGFDCQVVAEVPHAQHDVGVEVLITESRLLRFGSER